MTNEQRKWLETYNRETGSLSTIAAKDCGYRDLLRAGYVINRGPDTMPDLFITLAGRASLRLKAKK